MFRLKTAILTSLLSLSILTGCSHQLTTALAQNNTSVNTTYDISSFLPEDTTVVENTVDEIPITESDQQASANLTVNYIDIGQGDAELLTSDGHSMLIDTGTPESGTKIRLFLQKQGVQKLDYLVLTHPDSDHIGGAASVITNVPIDTVMMPDYQKDNKYYRSVIDALNYKYINPTIPVAGQTFTLGSCDVKVLGPTRKYDDPNNNSIVLKVTCGNTSFMFVGDAKEEELYDITNHYGAELDSDVYKVGHHGSHNSSSESFLRYVTPAYSVVSCAEGNSYGHPHAESLIRLRSIGSHLFRTDKQGTITIKSDGTNITYDPSPCDDWTPGENTQNSQGSAYSAQDTTSATAIASNQYILNTNTKKFHRPDCASVADIKEKNKKVSNQSRDEIINSGFKPCKRCNP